MIDTLQTTQKSLVQLQVVVVTSALMDVHILVPREIVLDVLQHNLNMQQILHEKFATMMTLYTTRDALIESSE